MTKKLFKNGELVYEGVFKELFIEGRTIVIIFGDNEHNEFIDSYDDFYLFPNEIRFYDISNNIYELI